MKRIQDAETESRIAAGIKTAAVVVLLGLIAIVAQPHRMPDELFAHPTAQASTATPVSASTGDADYLPSHYPAPTHHAEESPTF